ncbi:hypothetical protein [Terribacillus sp. JSM ZJ617]|uniref:hypothetical protein n=1 Tax=Terribacillus sp. JSM ZJ617 TaxID=3342119 RepID=UPI0035A85CF3
MKVVGVSLLLFVTLGAWIVIIDIFQGKTAIASLQGIFNPYLVMDPIETLIFYFTLTLLGIYLLIYVIKQKKARERR